MTTDNQPATNRKDSTPVAQGRIGRWISAGRLTALRLGYRTTRVRGEDLARALTELGPGLSPAHTGSGNGSARHESLNVHRPGPGSPSALNARGAWVPWITRPAIILIISSLLVPFGSSRPMERPSCRTVMRSLRSRISSRRCEL